MQYYDPWVGFYWYLEPAVFVSQSVALHGSVEVIDRQNDITDRVLHTRGDEVRTAGGLFVFNDWRSVKSYDQNALFATLTIRTHIELSTDIANAISSAKLRPPSRGVSFPR